MGWTKTKYNDEWDMAMKEKMHHAKFSGWLVLICALVLLPFEGIAQETIQVLAGRQRIISVPYGSQINIGDPSIATARAMPNQRQIIITGRSEGVTSLTIYLPSGGGVQEKMIRVLQKAPQTIVDEIAQLFGSVEGVRFEVRRSEVVAEGAVYTEADRATMEMILKRYPSIINRVEDKSEKLMLNINVEVLEILKTHGTELNRNGQPPGSSLLFDSQRGRAPFWSFRVEAALLDRIAYWKSHGVAKVIANPTLSVTNGDTARFLAGGEFPVTYNAGLGAIAIEYKEFGVRLQVVPRLTGTGKFFLDIMAEVSSIDLSAPEARTQAPTLFSRRVSSKGLVEEGETIALAGIYQRMITRNRRRVPILGHVLPFLFSSIKESEEVKELIVLVTPRSPIDFDMKDYPMLQKELGMYRKGS